MKTMQEIVRGIRVPDAGAGARARARWDSVAKPLGSLGVFEEMIVRIAALKGTPDFDLRNRALIVFCADNGVVARGVSQCGSEVTARVAAALAEGRSTANTMARQARCRVIPADVGILDFPGHPGVRNLRVRNGAGDISREPAMTEEECRTAMAAGVRLAEELARDGTDLLALGEMGIGNTTAATAFASALLGLDPEKITGRGAGLSTPGLERKKAAIQDALGRVDPQTTDTLMLLSQLGSLDIAAMCGAFLGAASMRVPVIVDGMISAAAALAALRLCPDAGAAMLASHVSSEPLGKILLRELGLRAPLDAGMHLGEGSGALMLMPLLDTALAVYRSGQSFERLGIEAYRPLT